MHDFSSQTNKVEIWARCLTVLKEKLGTPTFETLFKTSYPVSLQDNLLKVAVPNKFTKERIETKFIRHVKETLSEMKNQKVQLEFTIDEALETDDWETETKEITVQRAGYPHNFLNQKFTFDTFVIGNSNHLAFAAALAVAEAPAKAYNPFFIYGGVGLGKTHLIHAIAHYVLKKSPHLNVVYRTAEKFGFDVVNYIQKNSIDQLHSKYRNADLLLIDDIQFIIGRERTQEEFFHTFNALHSASKQIVISSDSPPKHLALLEDRLKSRFEWGLIADVQPPDLETREAILRKKAEIDQVHVPNDVISYIAERVTSNIRELEGTLNRVTAFSSLHRLPIDLNSAKEALKDILHSPVHQHLTIAVVQKTVAEYFSVSVEELKAAKRDQRVVKPRQIAMYLCRELIGASLPHIGEEFGQRDHTTVLHAYRKIQTTLEDPTLSSTLKALTEKLNRAG
jgi:chromosomal replication initiator protein